MSHIFCKSAENVFVERPTMNFPKKMQAYHAVSGGSNGYLTHDTLYKFHLYSYALYALYIIVIVIIVIINNVHICVTPMLYKLKIVYFDDDSYNITSMYVIRDNLQWLNHILKYTHEINLIINIMALFGLRYVNCFKG